MILAGAAALLLLAFGGDGDEQQPRPRPAQGGIDHRPPADHHPRAPSPGRRRPRRRPALIQWRESRGPRCIPAGRIIGADRARARTAST